MGRNRDAYWEGRRAMRAYRARRTFSFAPRAYAFDREALIEGASGRVCLEKIVTPPKDTPQASWRVIARWTGLVPTGSVITVGDRSLVVLRVRPMGGRRMVAHILCEDQGGTNAFTPDPLDREDSSAAASAA
jgi:hypothetical protein